MSSHAGDTAPAVVLGQVPVSPTRAAGEPSTIREPTVASAARLALRLACALTIAVGLVALTVRLGLAAPARHWLAFPFAGIPARPGVALSIFAHNLRALLAVGGLLLVAQSAHGTAYDRGPGQVHRIVQRLGEALLGAAVAANVIVIGGSLGAYGGRMVRAALPHGPCELAAYSLALALYLQGRNRPLHVRHALTLAALSVALLALAAVLETFVNV